MAATTILAKELCPLDVPKMLTVGHTAALDLTVCQQNRYFRIMSCESHDLAAYPDALRFAQSLLEVARLSDGAPNFFGPVVIFFDPNPA